MPIRAEFRHLYGRQWLTVTRPRILERAGEKCERCRKPLHAWIFTYTWKTRDPQFSGAFRYHMIWIKEGSKVWLNQDGRACSPLRAKGLPRTPTTIPPTWTTRTSGAGAPGATSTTTSLITKDTRCQAERRDAPDFGGAFVSVSSYN